MSSNFNEVSQSALVGRRVATPEELVELRKHKDFVEEQKEILYTPENRRKGIQILILDLLRCYQQAFQFGNLPFTTERRDEFDIMMANIDQTEHMFDKRFVNPGPEVETNRPEHSRAIASSEVQQPQSRLHALLDCIRRQPRH